MVTAEVPADRVLERLYEMTDGRTTTMVRGEDLARRMGVAPDDESDEARFLSAATHLEEEEGHLIANKTGTAVRDYSSPFDARRYPGGGGRSYTVGSPKFRDPRTSSALRAASGVRRSGPIAPQPRQRAA
jgi:hypothetical protein